MAYSIGGQNIKRPMALTERRVEQYAQQKALDGTVGRDYFSSRVGTKRVWELDYENILPADYDTIDAVYTTYKSTDTVQTFEINEDNLVVEADCHMDLVNRSFNRSGDQYLSSFTLILTEE